ncbi:GNAT family N-acetyltransferase [Prevotella sp. KH2C16]|uniref:GNAT family N-acetyltransferase n=1 Tax=Prevotella sp. KH2C16 TaxID=1855325 RepID=UPI0008ECF28D|nr:GNAT family N-acetyltransferase [Prevotella sp. KH2C16]SFG32558.1 Acetyltransferase (GNAT) domain-containing protein [Prevotella sp. KH2C16]
MFEIRRYTAEDKALWDRYVGKARNATFLFYRDYMDYHADRFEDFSLLFYKGRRLYALLPAHREGTTLYSHFGLTYGGLLMDIHVTAADTCVLFEELNGWLRAQGFRKVVYRPVPWVYHRHPSEEDLYAIYWKCGARLRSRNIGTTIFMQQHLRWRKDHLRRLRKSKAGGVIVRSDAPLAEFWEILNKNLMNRFQARPVHTLEEIELLRSRFPKNIIQYSAYKDGHIIGGITFYITARVVHGQYSATNAEGKELGAMEAIYERVMYHDYPQYPYLDFGSSTEQNGSWLNEGLIAHKEGYGGRSVVYDTYEWDL